jgi:energy-coupling factor transport system permease protein
VNASALWLDASGGSWLHRLDPAAKVVSLLLWFAVILMVSRPPALATMAILVAGAFLLSGTAAVLLRFTPFLALLFSVSAALWGIFTADPAGWQKGMRLGARLAIMLALGLLVLAATRVEELAAGLRRLGLPWPMAFSLTLAFRLLPLFAASGRAIAEAQACRGLDPRAGWLLRRLRHSIPLLVPLVLMSLRSAGALAAALESRGLGMHPRRTSVLAGRLGWPEAAAVALSGSTALALAALRLMGWML